MTLQKLGGEAFKNPLAFDDDSFTFIKIIEQILYAISESFKKNRDWEFPTSVNSDVNDIFWIDFHIDPGTSNGNDPGAVDYFTARV